MQELVNQRFVLNYANYIFWLIMNKVMAANFIVK